MSNTISGQGINVVSRPVDDAVRSLKEGEYYKKIQEKLALERDQKGIWVKSKDRAGNTDYFLDVAKLSTKSFFTTVKTHEGMVKVPLVVKMIMGEKINLKDRIESIIESYMKSVVQTTSHNLMMSRLAGMKMSSLAFILSVLGVPAEELKKLKQKALDDAITENVALFEENIYNSELLEILGGSSGSRLKAERSVLDEIQKQILTQAKHLNIDDYYTKEKIIEMKIRVDKEIAFKFKEEEQNLQYELDYYS